MKTMTAKDFKHVLAKLNFQYQHKRTGHPDYERIFIKLSGVTLGRATIFKGNFDHIKWYKGSTSWKISQLYVYIDYDYMMQKAEYEAIMGKCKQHAKRVYNERVQWRKDNPPKSHTNWKGEVIENKRKSLVEPNPANFFDKYLDEFLESKGIEA